MALVTAVVDRRRWSHDVSILIAAGVAVSGDCFTNAANRLQLLIWPLCVPGTELARIHVLDHALAQRADSIHTHRKLLS